MATLCKKANLLPRTTIAKRISKPRQLSHTTATRRQAKSFKDLSTLLPPNSSNPNTVILLDDEDSLSHSSNSKTVIMLDDDDTLNHSSNPKTVILLDDEDSLNHSVCYPPSISYEFIFEYANRNHLLLPPTRDSTIGAPSTLLPPNALNQKTVVLDLDQTLINTTIFRDTSIEIIPPVNYDFLVSFGGAEIIAYVTKRPFVDEFLHYLDQKNLEIVVFTAGSKDYASAVLDKLDPNGFISHRLYRDSRKLVDGKYYVKDLSNLGRDLKNVVIVDDKPTSYELQPENGIPIKPFIDDLQDNELKKLMDSFFKCCDQYEDLKDALKHYRGLKVNI